MRIFTHTDLLTGFCTSYTTLTDLCKRHSIKVGTARKGLSRANPYKLRSGAVIQQGTLNRSKGKKRSAAALMDGKK